MIKSLVFLILHEYRVPSYLRKLSIPKVDVPCPCLTLSFVLCRKLEKEILLIATHYIEKDRDMRKKSKVHKTSESARRRLVCVPYRNILVRLRWRVFTIPKTIKKWYYNSHQWSNWPITEGLRQIYIICVIYVYLAWFQVIPHHHRYRILYFFLFWIYIDRFIFI